MVRTGFGVFPKRDQVASQGDLFLPRRLLACKNADFDFGLALGLVDLFIPIQIYGGCVPESTQAQRLRDGVVVDIDIISSSESVCDASASTTVSFWTYSPLDILDEIRYRGGVFVVLERC